MSAALILAFVIGVVLLVAGIIKWVEDEQDDNDWRGFV